MGKYRGVIGLSDYELREVSDYFRVRDGRVDYRQFCKVVCGEGKERSLHSTLECRMNLYLILCR